MTTISDFNDKTEAGEVVSAFADSVKGKTILITGVGPNGLGATLAESLASQSPALLILSGRTLSKVEITSQDVATKYPSVKIRLLKLDLASFDSVDAAAAEVNAYPETSIDVLINNAGVMNIPERTLSTDGVEMHLMVNYLGAFCFTNSVMGKLLSRGGRIVNVGSNGYALSPFRFADYNFADKPLPESEQPPKALCKAFGIPWGLGYLPEIAYGQSKTAMMLYSVQLCHLLHAKGVTAVTANPGAIATDLWRHMPSEATSALFAVFPMKSKSQGVSTTLVAALDPGLQGSPGLYLEDCQPLDSTAYAKDPSKAENLWKLSEGLSGKSFTW